jgi:hypothetical protein
MQNESQSGLEGDVMGELISPSVESKSYLSYSEGDNDCPAFSAEGRRNSDTELGQLRDQAVPSPRLLAVSRAVSRSTYASSSGIFGGKVCVG